jgi:hypothetical protein
MTLFCVGSGVTVTVAKATARRPGLLSATDAALSFQGKGRAAPNTHADSGGPAPQSKTAVPGTRSRPVPILVRSQLRGHSKCDGLTSASGRVQFGTAHGRGGSSGVSSLFRGAAAGVGWTLGWCFGTKPVLLETASADLVRPPTHRRGVAPCTTADRWKRKRPASHQTVRMPGLRPRTPAADSWSTDNGVSSSRAGPIGSR